jgi:hypothetical protein
MMRYPPPTEAELIVTFNGILEDIVNGKAAGCPTCTGLDPETVDILNLLGQQPDPKLPADIQACRTEFSRMLDGTHAAEAEAREEAEWANLLK